MPPPPPGDPIRPALLGEWLHSKEEDAGGTIVLRRPEYDFPPARFRQEWHLRADGSCRTSRPAADDRLSFGAGESWSLVGDHTLVLHTAAQGTRSYEIVSAETDRLVLKERPPGA